MDGSMSIIPFFEEDVPKFRFKGSCQVVRCDGDPRHCYVKRTTSRYGVTEISLVMHCDTHRHEHRDFVRELTAISSVDSNLKFKVISMEEALTLMIHNS